MKLEKELERKIKSKMEEKERARLQLREEKKIKRVRMLHLLRKKSQIQKKKSYQSPNSMSIMTSGASFFISRQIAYFTFNATISTVVSGLKKKY